MASWGDLHDLIRKAEEALLRLQVEKERLPDEVLKEHVTGCYSRAYLVERLPAEVARSDLSGRPFGLGLIRFSEGVFDEERRPTWGRLLSAGLDPIDVPIRFGPDVLLILCPELDVSATYKRIDTLVHAAAIAGLAIRNDVRVAAVSYPKFRMSASGLLTELEKRLTGLGDSPSFSPPADDAPLPEEGEREPPEREGSPAPPASGTSSASPLDRVRDGVSPVRTLDTQPTPTVFSAPGETTATRRPSAPADQSAEPKGDLVAVGFAGDRQLPVSFWHHDELHVIAAILSDNDDRSGERQLLVKTGQGEFHLVMRSSRWYVRSTEPPLNGRPRKNASPTVYDDKS